MTRTVLVVDDDQILLRSVQKLLTRNGYTVLPATDVEQAMDIVEGTRLDAAVVDHTLARDTGLSVLAKLNLVQPRCVRLLMTGRTGPEIFVDAVNHGEVAKVLRKPFPNQALLASLEQAFHTAARMRRVMVETDVEESEADRQALDQAVRRGLLDMALQPILEVSPTSQRTVAYEALLRPRHERLNTPVALLNSAERQDRVLEIGSALMGIARRCLERIPAEHSLFINLHPAQLGDPDRLLRDLEPFGSNAGRVTLEITERSPLHDIERWEESVRGVTDAGFSVALDDLGAGFASLGMLADLDPQYIKLDMALVRNIHEAPRRQRLVTLLQTFGAATGAQVIAEGVENAEEARVLADCGITLMQGYYWARPSLVLDPT